MKFLEFTEKSKSEEALRAQGAALALAPTPSFDNMAVGTQVIAAAVLEQAPRPEEKKGPPPRPPSRPCRHRSRTLSRSRSPPPLAPVDAPITTSKLRWLEAEFNHAFTLSKPTEVGIISGLTKSVLEKRPNIMLCNKFFKRHGAGIKPPQRMDARADAIFDILKNA